MGIYRSLCAWCGCLQASQQNWLLHLVALVLEWLRVFYTILEQVGEEEEAEPGSNPAEAGSECEVFTHTHTCTHTHAHTHTHTCTHTCT